MNILRYVGMLRVLVPVLVVVMAGYLGVSMVSGSVVVQAIKPVSCCGSYTCRYLDSGVTGCAKNTDCLDDSPYIYCCPDACTT